MSGFFKKLFNRITGKTAKMRPASACGSSLQRLPARGHVRAADVLAEDARAGSLKRS